MPMDTVDRKEIVMDVRGQVCPSTLLLAMATMNEHRNALLGGEVALRILSDNRHAIITIPETARNMGYAADVKQDAGYYTILISLKVRS